MENNLTSSLRGALARRRLLMSSSIDNNDIIYQLPKETTFNGTSDYINTGIKLFDVTDNFTMYIRVDLSQSNDTNIPCFHCLYEQNPYYGLALQNGFLVGNGALTHYTPTQLLMKDNQQIVVVYDNKVITRGYYKNSLLSPNIQTLSMYSNEFHEEMTKPYLILGAYQTITGEIGRFWKGTIYDFKVYNRVLSDDEINDLFV